jgi:hypothetical protein
MLGQFTWIVVYGALGAFGFGWGTGANDVGNAFGTSVGAKTLTMMQACIIAAIFEFGGAMLLGRVSTQTIAGEIANAQDFIDNPIIYGKRERKGGRAGGRTRKVRASVDIHLISSRVPFVSIYFPVFSIICRCYPLFSNLIPNYSYSLIMSMSLCLISLCID